MKVAICDDEKYFVDILSSYLRKFSSEKKQRFDIRMFSSPQMLLNYLHKDTETDIVFLDICFEQQQYDGINIAKDIAKINPCIKIVFVSSHEEYAVRGYTVSAIGYLVKPIKYEEFSLNMGRYIKKIKRKSNEALYIRSENRVVIIEYDKIIYIETEGRNTKIHTTEEIYLSNEKMKDLETWLHERRFCRCHSAFIVNFQFVKSIKGLDIELKSGDKIHISKYRKKNFKKALTFFFGEQP